MCIVAPACDDDAGIVRWIDGGSRGERMRGLGGRIRDDIVPDGEGGRLCEVVIGSEEIDEWVWDWKKILFVGVVDDILVGFLKYVAFGFYF